jgi:ketosteroid isomerase-like protein
LHGHSEHIIALDNLRMRHSHDRLFRPAGEEAIRQADAAPLKAIAFYYHEGASLLAPNAPITTGREEIRKAWERMFSVPGFTLTPKIAEVEVARSGHLANVLGSPLSLIAEYHPGRSQRNLGMATALIRTTQSVPVRLFLGRPSASFFWRP